MLAAEPTRLRVPTRGKGQAKPRLAPPTPARSGVREFAAFSASVGIELFPWQQTAARYITATAPDGRWLYPEVAIIVARQNGKTRILVPHILSRLLAGRRLMHTAQNRELPREVFGEVADIISDKFPDLLKSKPRFANGQEEIRLKNGGTYRIVAPTRGGARGPSNDDLIIDELREMDDHDFIAAAKPTLVAAANPQLLYLSNAGTMASEVLNALRKRREDDPSLAYLEWSASPERDAGDAAGWREANPAIGHLPQLLSNLEREYRGHTLGETLAIFETENLCRWVKTMRDPIVTLDSWGAARGKLGTPKRASIGINMDSSGTRASAVLAWQEQDGRVHMTLIADVTGNPIDTDRLGVDLRALAMKHGAPAVGFDAWTDAELAKYFKHARPIRGQEYANASANFANRVENGQLVWDHADAVTADLEWTARKFDAAHRAFMAVKAKEDRPTTASFAAIRAVWLASGPTPLLARVR